MPSLCHRCNHFAIRSQPPAGVDGPDENLPRPWCVDPDVLDAEGLADGAHHGRLHVHPYVRGSDSSPRKPGMVPGASLPRARVLGTSAYPFGSTGGRMSTT